MKYFMVIKSEDYKEASIEKLKEFSIEIKQ